jgi:hypothetical protein
MKRYHFKYNSGTLCLSTHLTGTPGSAQFECHFTHESFFQASRFHLISPRSFGTNRIKNQPSIPLLGMKDVPPNIILIIAALYATVHVTPEIGESELSVSHVAISSATMARCFKG